MPSGMRFLPPVRASPQPLPGSSSSCRAGKAPTQIPRPPHSPCPALHLRPPPCPLPRGNTPAWPPFLEHESHERCGTWQVPDACGVDVGVRSPLPRPATCFVLKGRAPTPRVPASGPGSCQGPPSPPITRPPAGAHLARWLQKCSCPPAPPPQSRSQTAGPVTPTPRCQGHLASLSLSLAMCEMGVWGH